MSRFCRSRRFSIAFALTAGVAVAVSIAAGCRGCATPARQRQRLLLVGIDGADWSVIKPLVANRRMPTFAGLIARGSAGDLETIEPILSPIIWTTIATGRNPEEHGITWFLERDEQTGARKPITSRLRRTTALWNIASAADLRVGVAGWWATWPAEKINGWMLSDHVAAHGFGMNADACRHPPRANSPAAAVRHNRAFDRQTRRPHGRASARFYACFRRRAGDPARRGTLL